MSVVEHNHLTADIKSPGKCPRCDLDGWNRKGYQPDPATGPEPASKGGVTYSEFRSMLAEGFHTAFRKAIDGPDAMPIHRMIASMDDEDWSSVIEFVADPTWDLIKERGGITGDKVRP